MVLPLQRPQPVQEQVKPNFLFLGFTSKRVLCLRGGGDILRQRRDRIVIWPGSFTFSPFEPRVDDEAFVLHVTDCPSCERLFYRFHGMNEDGTLNEEDAALYAEAAASGMSVEEGWQDLLRRCPDLAEAYAGGTCDGCEFRGCCGESASDAAVAASVVLLLLAGGCSVRDRRQLHQIPSTSSRKEPSQMISTLARRPAIDAWRRSSIWAGDAWTWIRSITQLGETAIKNGTFAAIPLGLKAQQVLGSKNVQADWIDILMFSAAIWQFHSRLSTSQRPNSGRTIHSGDSTGPTLRLTPPAMRKRWIFHPFRIPISRSISVWQMSTVQAIRWKVASCTDGLIPQQNQITTS